MENLKESKELLLKIIIVGEIGVGKTNILTRFIKNEYSYKNQATIGVDFFNYNYLINNTNVKIQFWDTSGQERYRTLNKIYFNNSNGIILVYDVTNPNSFEKLDEWLILIKNNVNSNNLKILLLGNKIDLINKEESINNFGKEFAIKHDLLFFETSAKNNENIKKSFNEFILYIINEKLCSENEIYNNLETKQIEKVVINKTNRRNCCYI